MLDHIFENLNIDREFDVPVEVVLNGVDAENLGNVSATMDSSGDVKVTLDLHEDDLVKEIDPDILIERLQDLNMWPEED
ncbi:hypothetical protein [Vibrio phage RYC]|nr:hypothetical protein [Vibrio phage RYC]